jgi:Family of unknown function (DUF5996)
MVRGEPGKRARVLTMKHDLWPDLPYAAWKDTYATLHLWTQIVGKIRLAQTPFNHSWLRRRMQALSELGIDVAAATFPSNVRRDARQQMTSAFSDVSR